MVLPLHFLRTLVLLFNLNMCFLWLNRIFLPYYLNLLHTICISFLHLPLFYVRKYLQYNQRRTMINHWIDISLILVTHLLFCLINISSKLLSPKMHKEVSKRIKLNKIISVKKSDMSITVIYHHVMFLTVLYTHNLSFPVTSSIQLPAPNPSTTTDPYN